MKTNICTFLIVLLSFSFANAQDNAVSIETDNTITVFNNNQDVTVTNKSDINKVDKTEAKSDAIEAKENVVKTNSDIRVYLNRTRKVENIKWLFPKINKAIVA